MIRFQQNFAPYSLNLERKQLISYDFTYLILTHRSDNFNSNISFKMEGDFNIQETVNRNIQKNQHKPFYNHRSLIGWCSMNYPKVLVNPIYTNKPEHKERQYDLDHIFQEKQPKDRDKVQFTKPFTRLTEDVEHPYQKSSLTLAATKHDTKVEIF